MKEAVLKLKDMFTRPSTVANGVTPSKPLTVTFHTADNTVCGKLYEEEDGKLYFEGDVDESAKVFFEMIIEKNSKYIKELKDSK